MHVRGRGSFIQEDEEEEARRTKALVWKVGNTVSEEGTAQ